MTQISFPIEVFDVEKTSWRSESTTEWGNEDTPCKCYFTFKEEYRKMCDDMGLSYVVVSNFTRSSLKKKIFEIEEQNKILDAEASKKLYEILGLPSDYSGNLMKEKLSIPLSKVIELSISLYSKPLPQNKHLLLCDSIEIPDDLADKYLMLKLSMI